jgi:RNA polymerase sigma-70 factor, ECF subfamily
MSDAAMAYPDPGAALFQSSAEAGSDARGAGLAELFETEVFPHLRSLHATAWRLTGNVHDGEDLVQETCLRAFRAFERYTPGTNIKAWLYTILYRVRTDACRRAGRSPHMVELLNDGPGVPPAPDAWSGRQEEIHRALAGLPEVFRGAVVLRDVEELSYDEIAQVLGIPLGTVMSRIHRGRTLLRRALSGRIEGRAA